MEQAFIEVLDRKPRELKGTSSKSGTNYHFFIQEAVLDTGEERVKFEVQADPGAIYRPGRYTICPASLFVGRDERGPALRIRKRVKLIPLPQASAQLKAA